MYLFIKSKTTHNLSTVHRYGATQKVLYQFAEPNKKNLENEEKTKWGQNN